MKSSKIFRDIFCVPQIQNCYFIMSLAWLWFPLVQLASKLGCENCFSVCQFFSIVAKLRTPTGLIKPCRLFVNSAGGSERSFSTFFFRHFTHNILSKDFHNIVKDRSLDTTIRSSQMFYFLSKVQQNRKDPFQLFSFGIFLTTFFQRIFITP